MMEPLDWTSILRETQIFIIYIITIDTRIEVCRTNSKTVGSFLCCYSGTFIVLHEQYNMNLVQCTVFCENRLNRVSGVALLALPWWCSEQDSVQSRLLCIEKDPKSKLLRNVQSYGVLECTVTSYYSS